jgi:hypothetical protein
VLTCDNIQQFSAEFLAKVALPSGCPDMSVVLVILLQL